MQVQLRLVGQRNTQAWQGRLRWVMQEYVYWLIGGVVVCLLCLWGNMCGLRRRRLLADTPTSKVLGVFIGMTELKGTAEAAKHAKIRLRDGRWGDLFSV